jgi:hypothetical protein
MPTLTQSYRPGPNETDWPQPLEKSFVVCPKAIDPVNGARLERPIRYCISCDNCARLSLTTVECNYAP